MGTDLFLLRGLDSISEVICPSGKNVALRSAAAFVRSRQQVRVPLRAIVVQLLPSHRAEVVSSAGCDFFQLLTTTSRCDRPLPIISALLSPFRKHESKPLWIGTMQAAEFRFR
jgi:hypothetical protein